MTPRQKLSLAVVFLQTLATHEVYALCNGGAVVTSSLTLSADCDGWRSTPLTLGTNANVTIDPNVNVTNDGWNRNGDPVKVNVGAIGVSLFNQGTIYTYSQWAITNNGSIDQITNTGTIQSDVRRAIVNNSSIGIIDNSGFISAPYVAIGNGGTIGSIVNRAGGVIELSGVNAWDSAINNGGRSIDSITNAGTIRNIANTNANIENSGGTLTTFNNGQGAGNASGVVSIKGNLPNYYNAIIASASNYGQLQSMTATGSMAFNIYGNTGTALVQGISASTLALGTYANVLQGFSSLTGVTGTSGIYGAYRYSLVSGASSGAWDMVVSSVSTDITSASGNLKTALGSTLNRRFDGGVLTVDSASTENSGFTVTSNNGTIDQNGLRTRFSGVIANDGASPGKLIIANTGASRTGAVELTGTNTHTGGTDVESGAVLSIASANALGIGTLNLIGSATIPATLETTADMTISNPITVSGDPVFSVASGTTTTVSAPITDGVSSGDVVVSGGGTLNLTAVNTYTGPTTIDTGSTLALSGIGSITTSNAVSNNGTFDLTNATSTVNLGGSFTQSGTGILNMVGAPGAFQKIIITGTASVGGSLGLTAASGNYRIGRYTLLNAGSVTGTFSSFTNNLASVTSLGYLLSYDASNVYLNLAPNASATYQGIQQNSQALGNVINMQAAALQAGLSYDCAQYNENNLCVSVGGRYTYAGTNPSGNAQAGLVIVGYRPTLTTRIGAFADQSVNIGTPNNISQSKTSPMWGLFSTWQKNKDGNGLSVQGSAAVAASELTINRTASSITEAGSGKTQFNGQAYQLQANYAQPITDATKLIPYLGLRYTRINQGGYTETSNAQTLYPVSYNAMAQNTFSAIGGVGVQSHLAVKLKGTVAAGLQQNLNYSMGNYAGSSTIPGMTTFSAQMPGNTNTMATASAGLYYDVRKNEQIGLTTQWQQQPFINTNTTSVIATYTIGL